MLRAVVAIVWLAWGTAAAQSADPLYPITSFLDPLQNTLKTVPDPNAGAYNFEAGMLGIVTRAADRYPKVLATPQSQTAITNEIQATLDGALHLRPSLPYNPSGGDAGNADFMPDWNQNGVFGDPGDFDRDTDSDPHAVPGTGLDTAFFRYPCANPDGTVSYVDAAGVCTKSPPSFRVGVAREIKVVNARGIVIDATLWLPGHAASPTPLVYPCEGCSPDVAFASIVASGAKLPGGVFSDGFLSRQDHYYWFAMRMAREGFVMMTYDPAGQGESEGNAIDLFDFANQNGSSLSPSSESCQFQGACRDLQDMLRWFVGAPVTSVVASLVDKDFRLAARRNPETENAPNPTLTILDTTKVGVAGNSMGALSTLNYLLGLGNGAGIDGKPLPQIAAAVVMSGAGPTRITVPTQFQTSDYDGSPLLVGPSILGLGVSVSSGGNGSSIGYNAMKQTYNLQRDDETRTAPMELVILEGGVHTDHTAVPYVPRTNWAIQVASDYGADWFRCHIVGAAEACAAAVSDRPHISRAFASEHVAAGSDESQCIRVPDRAILNQPPADFLAAYAENKHVCDCAGETDGRTCDTPPTFMP